LKPINLDFNSTNLVCFAALVAKAWTMEFSLLVMELPVALTTGKSRTLGALLGAKLDTSYFAATKTCAVSLMSHLTQLNK